MPILKKIEKEIIKEKSWNEFLLPFYEKYCFSNIPQAIKTSFGLKDSSTSIIPEKLFKNQVAGSEKIVMFLIDGFGYYQWEKYFQKLDFFKNFTSKGNVIPLTSIFPSTTAATLTTINSGLNPNQHCLPEWTIYFKEIDMILDTLPFTPVIPKDKISFTRKKVNPKILFKGKTFYQSLNSNKVKPFIFMNADYAFSEYSNLAHKGATTIPYVSLADLSVKLIKKLEKTNGRSYFYVYIDVIDHISHLYGPHTEEYKIELETLAYVLQKAFIEKISKKTAEETTVMITADHGQINVNPEKTLYLNKFKKLNKNFARSKKGKTILPTGSARDMFIHVKDGKLEETKQFLQNKISKSAKIMESEEAIKNGLFGNGKTVKKFKDRIGDLLVLPYKNNLIWYEHYKGEKFKLRGHHGGLSKEEMMTELAIAKLSDLI